MPDMVIEQWLEETGTKSSLDQECKWYEHEGDMRAVSTKFPGVLFTLHGKGEEGGDLWRKYFLDGKCQEARAIIKYPAFDPAELA